MNKKYLQEIFNSPSALLLILSNLLVLVTVWASNMSVLNLILIYWLEAFIITFFIISKIFIYNWFFNYKQYSAKLIFLMGLLFGGTYLVYMPFIFVIFISSLFFTSGQVVYYNQIFSTLFPSDLVFIGFIISFLVLFISHLFSFLVHFKETPDLGEKRFGRRLEGNVIIFHVLVIFGLILVIFSVVAQDVLIVLSLVKTIIDLNSHLNYHK